MKDTTISDLMVVSTGLAGLLAICCVYAIRLRGEAQTELVPRQVQILHPANKIETPKQPGEDNMHITQAISYDDPRWQGYPCLITTTRRAFGGWMDIRNVDGDTVFMVQGMRNITGSWEVSNGVEELATDGPGEAAKLANRADAIQVTDVKVIRPMSHKAAVAWGIDNGLSEADLNRKLAKWMSPG